MGDGPLPPGEALAILRPLAAAVDHLHAQGVIHRDVKPANVMLDNEDRVKLTDLGIASAAQATGITTTGTILGTPAYMAPEMFDGDRATDAADVYSVAAIAFEMLTGRRAREGGTPAVVALRAATEPPPDVRDVWPEAAALAAAIAHGMARDPAERPASATALVDEIAAALEEDARAPVADAAETEVVPPAPAEPPRAAVVPPARAEPPRAAEPARPEPVPPPPPRRERRSPAVLAAAAAAVLAIVAIAAVLLTGGGADPRRGATSTPRSTTTGGRPATTPSTSTSTTGTTAAAAPTSPTGAVQAFYGRAAAHRYDDAWALAAPGLRQQLGGFRLPPPVLDGSVDRLLAGLRGPPHRQRRDRRGRHDGDAHRPRRPLRRHRRHPAGAGRWMAGRAHRDLVLTQSVSRVTTIAGSLMTSGGSLMRRKTAVALVALASLVIVATAVAQSFPARIDLPRGFQPEGIAIGDGKTFYVGSIPTGAIYRGDIRTGQGSVFIQGATGHAATGLKATDGRLYVSGAGTGKAWVYNIKTGALLKEYQLAAGTGPTFINDVTVTRNGAYFTDSNGGVIYRVPTNLGAAQTISLTGDFQLVSGFNLNGIVVDAQRKDADRRPDGERQALHHLPHDRRDARNRPSRCFGRQR